MTSSADRLPLSYVLAVLGGRRAVAALAAGAVAVAEIGRRRGGRDGFPATAALWAPAWLAERAVCSWLAVAARCRGGVRYRGRRVAIAATPTRRIRRRILDAAALAETPPDG